MKKVLLLSAFVLCLCVLAGVPAANAQSPVVVKVPFAFVVGDAVLPAGDYRIMTRTPNSGTMHIASVYGDDSAFVNVSMTESTTTVEQAALLFQRVGDAHFLWRVQAPGESIHEVKVPQRAVALELAKFAANMRARKR